MLICHADEPLHVDGVARWLAARTHLRGIVLIREARGMFWRRVRREWRRSGTIGLLDVLAFRLAYRSRWRSHDARWHAAALRELQQRWPAVSPSVPVIEVRSPNAPESEAFIRAAAPDAALALCKHILAPRIFELPASGTFVCHPGVAPEYRNAHGCFWALAQGDFDRVGMTMLRVDRGVDTGPVFGYFTYPYDAATQSHVEIQHRVLLDNLDGVADRLEAIVRGEARPISVDGRPSGTWGQPRLTAYWRLRRHLRERHALAHA